MAATVYALAVVALRIPGVIAGPDAFRFALALHVELAVFIWLASSMAGQWSLDLPTPVARAAPHLALIGTVLVVLTPLGGGSPVMADYFPWISDNLLFSGGFALFCIAVLGTAVIAVSRPTGGRTRTLSAWCVIAAALALAGDVVNGARDPYSLAWGAGHVLLFAHLAMMLWEWSTLTGVGQRLARVGGTWLALFAGVLALAPWVYPPGSAEHRALFTEAMRWVLWPPALALLAAITLAGWRSGRRPPAGVLIAIVLLPVGLLLGSAIDGQTTLVTAHYHAAIGAVAISRMSMTYHLHRGAGARLPHRQSVGQLITYSAGLALLIAGLLTASLEGAPRKTSASESINRGPAYTLGMTISGAGGLLAMAGSLWLVANLWRTAGGTRGHSPQGRAENRTAKCHPIASTPNTAAASNQGVVQS